MKRRTKILILTPNENGKLEFTQEELENLINDAYEEGYECGKADAPAITAWPSGVRDIENNPWHNTGTNPAEQAKNICWSDSIQSDPRTFITEQIYGCSDNCMDDTIKAECLDNCMDTNVYYCSDNNCAEPVVRRITN